MTTGDPTILDDALVPDGGHDGGRLPANGHALEDRLTRAEQTCARRGARLTDIRRNVLRLILESREPVGAYTLLDGLRARHGGGKPPTIYRALDFLVAQGLVHRVERLNAFVGCHDHAGHHHHHAAQFLICRLCGQVTEIEDSATEQAVLAASAAAGFHVEKMVVEVEGVCRACAALNERDAEGRGAALNPSRPTGHAAIEPRAPDRRFIDA